MKRKIFCAALVLLVVLGGITAYAATGDQPSVAPQNLPESDALETLGNVDYSIYEQYGLIYDEANRYGTYNGEVVRYFNDPIVGASFTNFFTGTVDLEAEYDANNNLVGIKECSQEVYDRHTAKAGHFTGQHGNSAVENGAASGAPFSNNDSSCEVGTPLGNRGVLMDYEPYGVSYDTGSYAWYYNNQRVKVLIDQDTASVFYSDEDGTCLVVLRDDNSEITGLKEISETEAKDMMGKNQPQDIWGNTFEG